MTIGYDEFSLSKNDIDMYDIVECDFSVHFSITNPEILGRLNSWYDSPLKIQSATIIAFPEDRAITLLITYSDGKMEVSVCDDLQGHYAGDEEDEIGMYFTLTPEEKEWIWQVADRVVK